MDLLFNEVQAFPATSVTIDLERQVIVRRGNGRGGEEILFEVQPFRKYCLLNGLTTSA